MAHTSPLLPLLYTHARISLRPNDYLASLASALDCTSRLRASLHSGCWGVVSSLGEGHRAAAAASGTSLNPARESAELFLELDCGAPAGERWSQCDRELRSAQHAIDLESPSDSWHYSNIANTYSPAWGAYYYGSENYARLKKLKAQLDPRGMLGFEQSVDPQPGELPKRALHLRRVARGGCTTTMATTEGTDLLGE